MICIYRVKSTSYDKAIIENKKGGLNVLPPYFWRCIFRIKVTSHATMISIYRVKSTSYDKAIIENKKGGLNVLPPYFWRCIFRIKVTSKLL
jgi:IMP cyclohydrolase